MRFKITFRSPAPDARLPLSYNAALSSTLKEWLGGANNDHVPPFVFSRLVIKSKLVDMKSSTIRVLSPTAVLHVGCYSHGASDADVMGSLTGRSAAFGLKVENVELLGPPHWASAMHLRMLSPTVVCGSGREFLTPDAPGFVEQLRSRLVERYALATRDGQQGSRDFEVVLEDRYVSQRGGAGSIVKNIRFQDDTGARNDLKAFLCPVILRGDPDIIAFAYDAGIGDFTTFGFGMLG